MEKYSITPHPREHGVRDYNIFKEHERGATCRELADKYGLTRQRVWAVVKQQKQDSVPGGYEARVAASNAQRKARRLVLKEEKSMATYGVGYKYIDQLRATDPDYRRSALGRFVTFRKNCRVRGIKLYITVQQWWDFWQASGYYENYGKYSLGRQDYSLGYEIGNLAIRTNSENAKYYNEYRYNLNTHELNKDIKN